MKTGNIEFIKTIGAVDYDYLGDTYTYTVTKMFDVEYKDDHGTWWDIEFEELENLTMTSKDLKKEYKHEISNANHMACMDDLKQAYNITNWN